MFCQDFSIHYIRSAQTSPDRSSNYHSSQTNPREWNSSNHKILSWLQESKMSTLSIYLKQNSADNYTELSPHTTHTRTSSAGSLALLFSSSVA